MRMALDVDDVLAQFTPHAFAHYGVELRKTDYWSVPNMDELLGEGWFPKIAVIKEFWETIPVLSSPTDIDFEVAYYISSFPQEMFDVRVEWLRKNGFPDAPLVVTSNKVHVCERLGVDVLIDDKPQTMMDLHLSSTIGLHFITPYAGFDTIGRGIESLKDVKSTISQIKQEKI